MNRPESVDDARILELGRETFTQEIDALRHLGDGLDESFVQAVRVLLACDGRVMVTGLGKSGNVAQ